MVLYMWSILGLYWNETKTAFLKISPCYQLVKKNLGICDFVEKTSHFTTHVYPVPRTHMSTQNATWRHILHQNKSTPGPTSKTKVAPSPFSFLHFLTTYRVYPYAN